MDKHLAKSINPLYFEKLLEFNDFEILERVGGLYKIHGFDSYNQLLNINSIFSDNPRFDPVDRTGSVIGPVKYAVERSWNIPIKEIKLETALENRVLDICSTGEKINILWSGGIDSTAILVAFLEYTKDLSQCRVIYSPWSTYEHPGFFKLLQTIPKIELLDISGEIYLDLNLDGIIVSGNSGDEIHASLDESFFSHHGYDFLFSPWRDFFYKKIPDDQFINFCEQYFSRSGRPIETVLDARWWFYVATKITGILNTQNLNFFTSGPDKFDPRRLIGFFDCNHYEQFIYFNIDKIICSDNYASWKQFLKDYCDRYAQFDDWRINKSKFGSAQIGVYTQKKSVLNDSRHLIILENGDRISSLNLPFFNLEEWNLIKDQCQHVFNHQ
jgi:hypothetical protein